MGWGMFSHGRWLHGQAVQLGHQEAVKEHCPWHCRSTQWYKCLRKTCSQLGWAHGGEEAQAKVCYVKSGDQHMGGNSCRTPVPGSCP